jgi:hypothetical protein
LQQTVGFGLGFEGGAASAVLGVSASAVTAASAPTRRRVLRMKSAGIGILLGNGLRSVDEQRLG